MNDDVTPLLKLHEYFRGVPDEVLREVAAVGRVTQHAADDVHEANELLTIVGFVLRGRLKAVRVDARGGESLFRMIERGEQFGMMVGALTEPVPIRVAALETTTVLNLDYHEAMELTFRHPDLRRLWLTTFTGSLRKHFFGETQNRTPMILMLMHELPTTRETAGRLIKRLLGLGEKLAMFGDAEDKRNFPDVPFRPLRVGDRDLEPEEIRRQAAE
jgi:NTE family protein